MRDLIEDCYDLKIPDFVVVDWAETCANCLVDYTEIYINGCTYYYR